MTGDWLRLSILSRPWQAPAVQHTTGVPDLVSQLQKAGTAASHGQLRGHCRAAVADLHTPPWAALRSALGELLPVQQSQAGQNSQVAATVSGEAAQQTKSVVTCFVAALVALSSLNLSRYLGTRP